MQTPETPEVASSPTVKQLLTASAELLREAGVDTPVLDAEVLLASATGMTRTALLTHPDLRPDDSSVDRFRYRVQIRQKRVPLAYILGIREFYGMEFEVTPAVLVPRPDTEVLVEATIKAVSTLASASIAEIGVGSGAVAVALAKSLPCACICGTELSEDALHIARRNAERHSVSARVKLYRGDLLDPVRGTVFDAVISNPPYIPTDEVPKLQPEVSRYEPVGALDGGADGLDCYRRIIPESAGCLKSGGTLLLEVGAGQAPDVMDMMADSGFTDVQAIPDYAGIERVVAGRR